VERWAIGGDGTHLTGGDPEAKSLRRLLSRVAVGRVGLVHAHGTGTAVSDPVELAAIESIVGAAHPVLYSHKGALGHSLGAAGLVSVVINCLCHSHGMVPGNVRSKEPLVMGGVRFSSGAAQRRIERSVALAAGFGGPLAAVLLASD
jgi:3-oxoacyl-[acyl-carrier-protein] synthase II